GLAGMVEAFCEVNRYVEAMILADAIPLEAEKDRAYKYCAAVCAQSARFDELARNLQAVSNNDVRTRVQSRLMQALVDSGENRKAILLAAAVAEPSACFKLIGRPLISAGYLSDAVQLALKIQNPDERSRAISSILGTLLNTSEANAIISMLRKLEDTEMKSLVLHELAVAVENFSSIASSIAHELEGKHTKEPQLKSAAAPRKSKRRGGRN